MRRNPLPLALSLIPAAALVAVLPLILHGCSCGHDFDFHLVSWMEAAAQFRAGVLHPSWAFSPGWNGGEPRFVFYPPLSWTLGAMLGIALPWAAVPIAYTWLTLVAAGFGMYRLAGELVGEDSPSIGPVLAAVVYLANPYMIFTAYERTAYAELLAAAWIPLLLAAILQQRVTVLRVAIPVALLWLTNAPAAVMGCYAFAFVTAVRLAWIWIAEQRASSAAALRECLALLSRALAGVGLGIGLAAFYVIPAAYERRWVQIAMAMISGMRITDNFLFHHTGDGPHDEVLHTASMIAVLLLGAALVALSTIAALLRLRRDGSPQRPEATLVAVSFALLTAAIGVLLTPLSAAVWRIAPEMTFLQFPWRLTAILAAIACAAIGIAAARLRLRGTLLATGALALVAALILPAVSQFRQQCDDEDTVAARLAVFAARIGTDPTDEYTPIDADNDVLAHRNPPFWLTQDGEAQPAPAAQPEPVPMHFAVDADKPEALVLNLRDYPAWVVRRNGTAMTERVQRQDGLIAFPVPAGRSRIDISYRTTGDQRLGEGISGATLIGVFALARRKRRPAQSSIIED